MIWPVDQKNWVITSDYGLREYWNKGKLVKDFHYGIDFAPKPGVSVQDSKVRSVDDGVCIFSGWSKDGQGIKIKHSNELVTCYWHTAKNLIKAGDKVSMSQPIAIAGMTGNATGVHLHFGVENVRGQIFNPNIFLKSEMPNTIIVQAGWGLSHVAKEAGYSDFASSERWDNIANLNGFAKWTDMSLYPGQVIKVRPEAQIIVKEVVKEVEKIVEKPVEVIREVPKEVYVENPINLSLVKENQELKNTLELSLQKPVDQPEETKKIDLKQLKTTEAQRKGLKYLWSEFTIYFTLYWNMLPKFVRIALTVAVAILSNFAIIYFSANELKDIKTEYFYISSPVLTSFVIKIFQWITSEGDKYIEENVGNF